MSKDYLVIEVTLSGLQIIQMGRARAEEFARRELAHKAAQALADRDDLITVVQSRNMDEITYRLAAKVTAPYTTSYADTNFFRNDEKYGYGFGMFDKAVETKAPEKKRLVPRTPKPIDHIRGDK